MNDRIIYEITDVSHSNSHVLLAGHLPIRPSFTILCLIQKLSITFAPDCCKVECIQSLADKGLLDAAGVQDRQCQQQAVSTLTTV